MGVVGVKLVKPTIMIPRVQDKTQFPVIECLLLLMRNIPYYTVNKHI